MPQRTNSLHYALVPLVLGALLAASSTVQADTQVEVLGSQKVRELAHVRQIVLGEDFIEVLETITLANASNEEAETLYHFDLPVKAAIVDIKIHTASKNKSIYGVVEAKAAVRLISDLDPASQPDLGLLRMVAREDESHRPLHRYELRVFPVPAHKSSTINLRWRSPVSLLDGRYSVRIPSRGDHASIARSKVRLRTTMPTSELYGGGARLPGSGAKEQAFFASTSGDLVIQAKAKVGKPGAHAQVALYPIGPDTGFATLRVVLPAAQGVHRTPRFRRALLLVDVSRSMGDAGREAAADFAQALLAQMQTGTEVEAILFDRKANQVLGELRAASPETRSKIVRAIRGAANHNGSDLNGALSLARDILGVQEKALAEDTLIVVISDGILPQDSNGVDAITHLGADLRKQASFLSAILVPPNAPLPNLSQSPTARLAYEGKGRISSFYHAEAGQRGKSLLKELAQPAALDALLVEFDRGHWVGADFRDAIVPGTSVTAFGYYEGGMPRRVSVQGNQAGEAIQLQAKLMSSSRAKALAQISLANTSPDSFPGGTDAKANYRAFQRMASTLGVVSEASAAVVLGQDDGFAKDRLAIAKRWGGQYYRRVPPPAEIAMKAADFGRFSQGTRRPHYDLGRTGALDQKIIARRIRSYAMPTARRCYDKLLHKNRDAHGTVRLHIEISRGEVHQVLIPRMAFSLEPIRSCIIDAVYSMPIPKVYQGGTPEQVNVVNYPLNFRLYKDGMPAARRGKVEGSEETQSNSGVDTNDPLSGLDK